MSNRQAEPLLRRKDDVHVAYWNVRTLQDNGVIKVSGEEACYHLYNSGVLDNTGRHGLEIALSEAAQAALLAWGPVYSRLASARLNGTTVNLITI